MAHNKNLARVICLVAIALSLVIGGVRSVSRLYSGVRDIFINGELNDGVSVSKDITENVASAKNLLNIAGKYLDATDPLIKAMEAAVAMPTDTISAAYDCAIGVNDAAQALNTAISDKNLSEKDSKNWQKQLTSITARTKTMANDVYNTRAERYNQKVSAFPASLWAGLAGIKTAPLFR